MDFFLAFFIFSLFLFSVIEIECDRERTKVGEQVGGEDLGVVEGREKMIKIYSMEKNVLVLKEKNDVEGQGRWIKG